MTEQLLYFVVISLLIETQGWRNDYMLRC